MTDAFICDAVRTPIGRYGGGLASIRADDLGALPLKALLARNPGLDPAAVGRAEDPALARAGHLHGRLQSVRSEQLGR